MATDAVWLLWLRQLAAQETIAEIAKLVRLDSFAVAGRIAALWELYDDKQGLPLPATEIDEFTRRSGFSRALIETGWAVERIGGLEFPVFEEYVRDQDQTRSQGQKRVSKHREQKRLEDQAKAIYKAFPKHVTVQRALQKIRIALGKVEFEFLLQKTQEYAESVIHLKDTDEWQKVPQPAAWYHNECWNDRPEDRHTAKPQTHRPGRVESPEGKYDGL